MNTSPQQQPNNAITNSTPSPTLTQNQQIDLSSSDGSEYVGKRKVRSEEETVLKLNRSIERANEIAEKSLL